MKRRHICPADDPGEAPALEPIPDRRKFIHKRFAHVSDAAWTRSTTAAPRHPPTDIPHQTSDAAWTRSTTAAAVVQKPPVELLDLIIAEAARDLQEPEAVAWLIHGAYPKESDGRIRALRRLRDFRPQTPRIGIAQALATELQREEAQWTR